MENNKNPSTKNYKNLPKIMEVIESNPLPQNWKILRRKTGFKKQVLGTGLNTLESLGLIKYKDGLYYNTRYEGVDERTTCNNLRVPLKTCYLDFLNNKTVKGRGYLNSIDEINYGRRSIPLETVRNEQFIIDFNKDKKIIGIELLESPKARKPCQEAQISKLTHREEDRKNG